MKQRNLNCICIVLIVVISILVPVFMYQVYSVQGKAKVINYAGIVRGATQKLVKEELHGQADDELMNRLDGILDELATGQGENGLTMIQDPTYQDKLRIQRDTWQQLKQQILQVRTNRVDGNELYDLSEIYFNQSDATVGAAQAYAEKIEQNLKIMEWLIVVILLCNIAVILLWGWKMLAFSRNNLQLKQIAYLDAVTGLSNQRRCRERLSDTRPIPEETTITCWMFDLNSLKEINDHYGHEMGNKVIAGFGKALKQSALPHMFAGRCGGDEFMAIAVGCGREAIEAFLQRLLDNCRAQKFNHYITISYSVGYAMSSEFSGYNIQALMDEADQRMYADKARKKSGRNNIR